MPSVNMLGMSVADLVLIHGFAGTGRAWDPVLERLDAQTYRAVAPDLRGHGAAGAARPVSFAACAADVLAAAPAPLTLCGYSLGGRIALHAALAAPARRASDEKLAAFADTAAPEAFADRWAAQPLFAGTPPEAARVWREDLLRNDPADLAAVLRGIGTGSMGPLWNRLGGLTMPATVVAGANDAKFAGLGERLAA